MRVRARLGASIRCVPQAAVIMLLGAASAGAQTRLVVMEEPDVTVVGIAVVLNSGSPWELESEAGLTHLAALATVEQLRPQLETLGGSVRVECLPAATVLTLLVPPTTWRLATLLFMDALFVQELSEGAVERAKDGLLRSLAARDAYTAGIRAALARALFGEDHRWARPPCGDTGTVTALTDDDVRRIRRARFRPTRAAAAVAGPIPAIEARDILADFAIDDGLPILVPAPAGGGGDGPVHVESPTVTTWTALAFPFAEETDVEALRLLAFQLREALGPSPARPDVFDVQTSIERHGDGGWLAVTLITAPISAPRREADARAFVRKAGEGALPREAFDALLRRYRGARLLDLATPEARARDAALQLFFDHGFRSPAATTDTLTPDRLRRAASALGASASASLGPT